MQFTSETIEHGVAERSFAMEIAGERVPGILWLPAGASGPRPLLLLCHGGMQHKRVDTLLARARSFVRHHGYACLSIDNPGHGERASEAEFAQARALRGAASLPPIDPERMKQLAARVSRAVGEWKAVLDAARALPEVGEGPVGWWGLSMGTAIGVPFIASEPRVNAAVLGLAGVRSDEFERAARAITVPVMVMCQWDDEVAPRDSVLKLFDVLGSKEKTLHANPGRHVQVPLYERQAWEEFFARHLGRAV
ncbi:alpha/beta hydrolase family protein [Tepidiforma sp.]|uniref:alpha/beta hydrolase family protein n=1 Tax=Tepidiforma sp. TaxID=2682230 RepID=UPI002ADDF9AB|nr:alpha/beta fold hydrolase [Tepidiforma sp.]